MDPKLKRDVEIFIGGLSYNTNERDVTSFFQKNGISFTSTRALSGDDGKFKGILFAMCTSAAIAQKACTLNGTKYMGRPLRINMAANK